MVERLNDEWIRLPTTTEELDVLKRPFRILGVPGAVCSQDGVHVLWNRCPIALKPDYTGKEGYPTLA